MVNILVCDDDKVFAKELTNKIKNSITFGRFGDFNIQVLPFSDAEAAIRFCAEQEVHIAFLDIDMPVIDGYDIAGVLKEKKACKIIFVSGFDQYVYKSFQFRPFWFIRKVQADEILPKVLDAALEELLCENDYLTLGSRYFNCKLFYSNILYVQSGKNNVLIRTQDKKEYEYRCSINEIEGNWRKYGFVRVRSSHLVNIKYVMYFQSNEVEMEDGTRISVSRKYLSSFREAYFRKMRK